MRIATVAAVIFSLVCMTAYAQAQNRDGGSGSSGPVLATPSVQIPASRGVSAGPTAAVRSGNSDGRGFGADSQWRYRRSGDSWWYWAPENRWMRWDDRQLHWIYDEPNESFDSGNSPRFDDGSGYYQGPSVGQPYQRGYETYRYYAPGYCRPGVIVNAPGVSVRVGGGHVGVDVGGLHIGF